MVCFVFTSCRFHARLYYWTGNCCKLFSRVWKRNTKVIALSVDGLESHIKWIKDIEKLKMLLCNTQLLQTKVRLSQTFMIWFTPMQMKPLLFGLFLYCTWQKIKLILTYPASTGRNFDEICVLLIACSWHQNTVWRHLQTGKTEWRGISPSIRIMIYLRNFQKDISK
jgi:alkyl hydroperoxide reductase subunit AhpC